MARNNCNIKENLQLCIIRNEITQKHGKSKIIIFLNKSNTLLKLKSKLKYSINYSSCMVYTVIILCAYIFWIVWVHTNQNHEKTVGIL